MQLIRCPVPLTISAAVPLIGARNLRRHRHEVAPYADHVSTQPVAEKERRSPPIGSLYPASQAASGLTRSSRVRVSGVALPSLLAVLWGGRARQVRFYQRGLISRQWPKKKTRHNAKQSSAQSTERSRSLPHFDKKYWTQGSAALTGDI
jgi:hypothetical protein